MSHSHGNTPERWTGVAVILLGGLLIAFGVVLGQPLLWILGIVAVLVGAVLWNVLVKGAQKKAAAARR